MKKTLLALVVLTTTVFASQAQIRFGAQAGAVFSKIDIEEDGEEFDFDTKVGLTVGVVADVPISENFIFQPGLNFTQKGGKLEESEGGVTAKSTINIGYVELPLNLMYRSSGGSGSFFIGAGPAISFAAGGKTKYKISGGGFDEEEEEDIQFGDGDDELKSLELSGNILAGYELPNGAYIAVNYNKGFSNLTNVEGDNSFKNSYFGVRIGFKFGGGSGNAKK